MSAEPAWKRLVRDLKERGFESKYLDRLYERLSPVAVQAAAQNGFRALEREILEEMAYALCRAEDKVNFALLEVDLAGAAIDENEDGKRHPELVANYNQKRVAAMRARWEYMVHREALGLMSHDVLEQLFPIPKPR